MRTITTPRVSIGLPVFNGEPFLAETLESLLAQTYSDFELIISDNASTDQTGQICQAFAARDDRIRYHRNEKNFGASRNYNRVFELSHGEYFKWAAADDLCAPEFLQRCVDILDRDPEVVVCYCKTQIIDHDGVMVENYDDRLHLQSPVAKERFLQLMRSMRECNAVFGLMRSEVLKKTRLIGNYVGSDGCLLAELCLHGKFYEIPEYLFFRRTHPGACSSNKDQEHQLEFFDPRLKGRIVFPWWRRRLEDFASVMRAPIRSRDKWALFADLAFGIFYNRKTYLRELQIALEQLLHRQRKGLLADR
ncbi:MAG: glycosyltransferase [candidate division KSB1 bacterium]|nr:glycosyltransferase [candidate division KSB1 bacterium]MDZ7301678.1 glycosyltransferase [candidate division KSB1 bacterium]MDZ7314298.1 glycosyltransferase [candidate division KSB1 bacterium]